MASASTGMHSRVCNGMPGAAGCFGLGVNGATCCSSSDAGGRRGLLIEWANVLCCL